MQQHKVNIVSVMNGKALTMLGSIKDKKQLPLCVKSVTKDSSQIFTLEKVKSFYVIKQWTTGKVLDVYKEKDTVYSDIIGYDYHGKDNQMWILEQVNNQQYMIINSKSKLALQIEGGIDADGMGIVQNNKYKYKNQLWKLEIL